VCGFNLKNPEANSRCFSHGWFSPRRPGGHATLTITSRFGTGQGCHYIGGETSRSLEVEEVLYRTRRFPEAAVPWHIADESGGRYLCLVSPDLQK